MDFQNLLYEKEDGVVVITINRPKALNALNIDTLLEIKTAVEHAAADDEVMVLIFTGAKEKSFVAGADITYMMNINALQGREFGMLGQQIFRLIENLPKPVIAAVNGFALGGGLELAMACDLRVCSENSLFGQPEVGLGVTPGFGGTQRMPRLVGAGMAKELLFTGDTIDAFEALRIGLVNHVVTADQLLVYVKNMARKICFRGQIAVRFCKVAVNEGLQTDIDRGLSIEADLFGLCFSSEDQKEGMKAFIEKRKANFQGA